MALGVALGGREVGLAIATREHLVYDGILNLQKIKTEELRERQFAVGIARRLDGYPVTRLAVVVLQTPGTAKVPLVEIERCRLAGIARERNLTLTTYRSSEVKAKLLPNHSRPSTRALGNELGTRFLSLAGKAPSAEPVPGADLVPELALMRRTVVTAHERYWSRMFLALGAALVDLDAELLSRLPPC